MKCPLMFAANDVFRNGRECIGNACMWRIDATDSNGNKTKTCAIPLLVTLPPLLAARPGLSISVQLGDEPKETEVD